jgi:hypothetical protein
MSAISLFEEKQVHQTVTNRHALKTTTADGKQRLTDVGFLLGDKLSPSTHTSFQLSI